MSFEDFRHWSRWSSCPGFCSKLRIDFSDQAEGMRRLPYASTCMMCLYLPRGVTQENDLQNELTSELVDIFYLTCSLVNSKMTWQISGHCWTYACFKDYKKHCPEMSYIHVNLKTYTGPKVLPMGKLKVKVKYEKQTCNFELFELKYGGDPLFGQRWLSRIKLNWHEIKSMKNVSKEHADAQSV